MRLYGKRFVKNTIERKTKAVQETRDAILWDIDEESNHCRVKIQGSNEYIIAHFPRNWKAIPYWLKRGNAVRILHRGGNRGYVEVTGEGRAIPSPVSGSAFPTEETLPDGVVSGWVMSATDMMAVSITTGTYRINGEIYSSTSGAYCFFDSESYVLFDSEPYELFQPEDGTILMYFDAAPSVGLFRYDAFCVGINGIIDYIKGTASSTPVQPSLPADHILLGSYILVLGGVTVIESKDIGRIWKTPYASLVLIDIESSGPNYEMPFVTGSPAPTYVTANIVLQIKDQYANNLSVECSATIIKNIGGGVLSPLSITFTSSTTLTWIRDQYDAADDIPVVFTVLGTIAGLTLTSVGTIIPLLEGV